MCCALCPQRLTCHARTDFHVHPAEHSFLPAPHYHMCRPTDRPCDLDCRSCGKLVREIPHLPTSHFLFGCCHRCAEYLRCDFAQRHRTHRDRAEAAPQPERVAANGGVEAASNAPKPDADRLRVLLLDDNNEFRESAVEFLALDPGLHVFGASDGYTALHIMQEFRPSVVVCDLMMEGINGFDVCRSIRKSTRPDEVHVLALTGFASSDMVRKALACGAEQCIAKPVRLQELKEIVLAAARAPANVAPASEKEESPAGAASAVMAPVPERQAGSSVEPSEQAAQPPVRVLVVDDDAAFLEATVGFLQGTPVFIVQGARNGFSALRQFFSFKPHVVVLDLFMPEVTGFDVCDAIRRSDLSSKTRILAVTGDASVEIGLKARMSGVDGCLQKPVKLDQLRQETWRLGRQVM